MASTLTRPLKLELADASDLREIAAQQHPFWGVGLTRNQFYALSNVQNQLPWGRKNLHVHLLRRQGQIVSSCKIYDIEVQSRSKRYLIAGIGGVFTPEQARGNGYATEMMKQVNKHCRQRGYDAALLFSDIDPGFYEVVGYELMPDNDFHIWTDTPEFASFGMHGSLDCWPRDEGEVDIVPLGEEIYPQMLRHYRRYLQRQPYGVVRSEPYLHFKLRRLQFRVGITPDWPTQEVITYDFHKPEGGYAIIEQGSGDILRVLEVIGNEDAQRELWFNILRNALLRKVKLIRGWEGTAPAFRQYVRWTQRVDWSRPMLHPINPDTSRWLEINDCPLLELDHF